MVCGLCRKTKPNQAPNNESFSEAGKILGGKLRLVLSRNFALNFLAMEGAEETQRLSKVLRRAHHFAGGVDFFCPRVSE